MQVISIVGARPQFVKVAPISWASDGRINHKILHTGQHYDPLLSESFFKTLSIPVPDFRLQIGSKSHGEQTGEMLIEIEKILLKAKPDHIIVYGDTNSTLAGALAASKIHIPISHVEAGLRSFNRTMPEEINRIVTDHISELLFAPTKNAMVNLENEGLLPKSELVGDVMVETLNFIKEKMNFPTNKDQFIFATIHRAENTDDPIRITQIIKQLRSSPIPVHLHCHPRLKKILNSLNFDKNTDQLKVLPPLDYLAAIAAISESVGVITDSGGLQKESYILKKPCMIIRNETEWIETLESGSNFLDPNLTNVSHQWWREVSHESNAFIFGDGTTSQKIIDKILSYSASTT